MGEMSDPQKNCVLEICCGASNANEMLTSLLVEDGVCAEPDEAKRVAKWVNKHFDLAEKGTLTAFKKSIARLAKA